MFPLSSGLTGSRVTSKYNIRRAQFNNRIHGGIDLVGESSWVSKHGQPDLLATISGTIYLVKYEAAGFGNYCVIRGVDGYYHIYGHMKNPAPWTVGQAIQQGQKVGDIGTTGHSTGIHLHYEVRQNFADKATRLDPCLLLGIANETGPVQSTGGSVVTISSVSGGNNAGYTDNVPHDYEELTPIANSLQSGDILFGRRCRVIVSDDSGAGADFTDLHITFQIIKTYLFDIQYSVIKIYNVNRDAEAFILRKGTTVHVEAGYEGAYYGEIFQGDIIQSFGHWEGGTDFVMDIIAADSERFLNEAFVSNNIERGMTQRQAVERITAKASVPTKIKNISDGLKENTLPRGKVFFGMAKDYLQQIAKGSEATLYMNNGEVNIIKATDLPADTILKLSPASGLIGQPQQTELGIKAKCLLLPQIKVERCVQVDSQYIQERQLAMGTLQTKLDPQGVYKIAKVTYSGDNRGSDWYAEFEAMTQSGYLPTLLANSAGNPF